MPTIERTVTTSAPPAAVWSFLSDFTTTEEWDPPTVRTERTAGDGGVGTRYENTSRILGHEAEIVYTVVQYEPQRRLRLHGESDAFTALDTIELTPNAGGTSVEYTADFTFTGSAPPITPFARLMLQQAGDQADDRLSVCLEKLA